MKKGFSIIVLVVSAMVLAGAGTFFITAIAVPAPGPPPKKANPKLQSSINELAAVHANQGQAIAADFAASRGLDFREGEVMVVLEASPGAGGQAAAGADSVGGRITASYGDLVQAFIPVDRLYELTGDASIGYIREPQKPVKFTVSEGVADIGAAAWHGAGGTGEGVKIAILDPGFAGYSQRVLEGELPAGVITRSFTASGDITGGGEIHGTACAEIVHDVAPGAQLYLVNFSTDVELGAAIDYLIAEGVDVVSASWGFYGSFRGDGQGAINDMVQGAGAAGIFWANAAGNSARSHWSGPFTDVNADSWHEFAAGDIGNDITLAAGARVDLYLTWNRWPATDQDYDMYLVWEGQPTKAAAASEGWQSGTQEPAEQIHYTVPSGRGGRYWVAIRNYSAAGDAGFQLYAYPNSLEHQVAEGSLGGQPTDSAHAMTVGAVPAGGTVLEAFSSRGPTIDGRTKPDIVAPDRVSTVSYGQVGFWGTSAAAPHAAAAGALLKAEYPEYTPLMIQDALELRGTDLGASGKDNLYGSGKLNMGAPPACGMPVLTLSAPSPFWASYADYVARELSVNWTFCNTGDSKATDMMVVGSENSNSVIFISPPPVVIGDLAGGGSCSTLTTRYLVPAGVLTFRSTTYLTAGDRCGGSYSYPAPYLAP